jgi:hypothetical protein
MKEHADPSTAESRKGARRKGRKPTDRFPPADELAAALNQWRGELTGPDPWEMLLRFDRDPRAASSHCCRFSSAASWRARRRFVVAAVIIATIIPTVRVAPAVIAATLAGSLATMGTRPS